MPKIGIDASELGALADSINDKLRNSQEFMQYWAEDVRDLARDNALGYGSGFWGEIARATRIESVSDSRAVIVNEHVAAWHKHAGGPIAVRNKNWLTIPMDPRARGKDVWRLRSEGYKIFRPGRNMKTGKEGCRFLAIVENKKLVPLFALTKRTRPQRAFPWWPSEKDAQELGAAAADEILSME